MTPRLRPGDRLLVHYGRSARIGSIVVARFADHTVVIKRVAAARATRTGEPGWWLLSDSPEHGVDSRHRGPVAETDILGVAIARLWPRPTWRL